MTMQEKSWTEIQALAVKAATGAGVPPAQSLAFGAMVPRHLADDGAQDHLSAALNAPDMIVSLAQQVETMIEAASLSPRLVAAENPNEGQCAVLVSWLSSLPCQADVVSTSDGVQAYLSLGKPSIRVRPVRVAISPDLFSQMQSLAERTYVPDSAASRASGAGEGPGAMMLD